MSENIEDPFADAQVSDSGEDPFADALRTPAVSFKDAPVGTKVRFLVKSEAKMVQSRDFESGDPATWSDGNPKMAAVFQGEVGGEARSLWAPKPSSMFTAIAQAQADAGGRRIGTGDTLIVTLTGTKPNSKNPKLNDQKLYTVEVQR